MHAQLVRIRWNSQHIDCISCKFSTSLSPLSSFAYQVKSECPTGTIGRHAISLAVGIAVIADACADAAPADVLDDAADGADMMGWS